MTTPDDDRARDENGRFAERMSLDDVLDALTPGEPYTTGEIADRLDLPRTTANYYLNQLAKQDRVHKKKPDPVTAIWMRREE